MLDLYRSARYHDGGRGECVGGVRHFDCYGLVRAVRSEQYRLPTMPALAHVYPRNSRQVHRSASDAVKGLAPCDAKAGAMALCWQGRIATHCGVVVTNNGRVGVLECHQTAGVRWQPLRKFCSEYTKVEFYT